MRVSFGVMAALAGCGFSPNGATVAPGDGSSSTAPPDSNMCTPGQTACSGRVRQTCGASSTWDPSLDHTCDFTCAAGECVVPTNADLPTVIACGSAAPALDPGPAGTVTYDNGGGAELTCSPSCNGVMTIQPVKKADNIAWFCVSSINLQTSATLVLPSSGISDDALGFIVDGTAMIAGSIALDGGNATQSTTGGAAGPGGFAGENLNSDHGGQGGGCGGGQGGDNDGSSDHWVGGGGGGGGNFEVGGGGGSGECTVGDHFAKTSTGGGACNSPDLAPLVGGSGGGAGGDATTGVQQGWAGGGGGGALQIAARLSISITGVISARGGLGYGVAGTIDGGGGGGAGGGVLLESPAIAITGSVLVDGGTGGASGSGLGGVGATGTTSAQSGRSFTAKGQGGSGGGGSGGRVRINAVSPVCAIGVSPVSSCTTGMLSAELPFVSLSAAP